MNNELRLNNSFIDGIILNGLMNESYISLYLLDGSDSDGSENTPLSTLKEQMDKNNENADS